MKRLLLTGLVACLCLPASAYAEEGPVTIGNQPTFKLSAPFSPERLSSNRTIPVSLTLRVQVERGNFVGPLPGISETIFRLDRAFAVDLGAGTRCGGPPSDHGRRGCSDAIARVPVLVALDGPIQKRLEIPMRFGPSHDPAIPGTQIELNLPPSLDGGAAKVRALSVTFPANRAPTVAPAISARCPKDGHTEVSAEATLDNEEVHSVDLRRHCRSTA